jgi:hypothetical protein
MKTKTFGLIGLFSTIIGFISKAFYREYIYAQQIDDFGIANFAPSFFYVLGFSQLMLIRPTKYPYAIAMIVMIASILYELMQYRANELLDFPDIIASIMGAICSMIIIFFTKKKLEKTNY